MPGLGIEQMVNYTHQCGTWHMRCGPYTAASTSPVCREAKQAVTSDTNTNERVHVIIPVPRRLALITSSES